MAACCAISALIIYHLMNIHSRLASTRKAESSSKHGKLEDPKPSDLTSLESEGNNTSGLEGTCRLHVQGMTCQSCVIAVTDSIKSIQGVDSVSVSLLSQSACVLYNIQDAEPSAFVMAIENAGFVATVMPVGDDWKAQWLVAAKARKTNVAKGIRLFRTSAVASGLLFGLQMALSNAEDRYSHLVQALEFLELSVALACVVLLAAPIHLEAYRALRHRQTSSSLLSSAGLLLVCAAAMHPLVTRDGSGQQDDSSSYSLTTVCMLLTVILGGRVTKSLVTEQSTELPTALATVIPDKAQIVVGKQDGSAEVRTVPSLMLQVGDEIIVGPGTAFPADCTIVSGTTSVLETITRGETSPSPVSPGDTVLAGCTNCECKVIVQVVRIGRETWLGQTLQAFDQTNDNKTGTSMQNNRILDAMPSLVLVYAFLVGSLYVWRGEMIEQVLTRLATILLCACPCTLGLGVPMCLMASSLNAYKKHILLRPNERMISAASAGNVVFDKTGTLTNGDLRTSSIQIRPEWSASPTKRMRFWHMVGKMTSASTHPVSVLLQQVSKTQLSEGLCQEGTRPLSVVSHMVQPGLGQSAVFSLQDRSLHMVIGNNRMMQQNNIYVESQLADKESTHHTTSSVYVAVDGKYAGCVRFTDAVVSGAAALLRVLHERNIATYIMTGDTKSSAQCIGRQVGIHPENIFAGQLPHDKAALVEKLEQKHGPVIMVGDNLNDAAALATASLGIVVSHALQDTHESAKIGSTSLLPALHAHADAYLLPLQDKSILKAECSSTTNATNHNLGRIVYILDLINETSRRINKVTKWSMVYNSVSLIFASGIINIILPGMVPSWLDLSPASASLAMSMSSLFNLRYALRLGKWQSSHDNK